MSATSWRHEVEEEEEEEEEAEALDSFDDFDWVACQPGDFALDDAFPIDDWRTAEWDAPVSDLTGAGAGGAVDDDPTALLFTKLDAPEVVEPDTLFDVVLGLTAEQPDEDIEPIEVPMTFELSMSIRTGFQFAHGGPEISFRVDLRNGLAPQRTVTLRAGEVDDEIHVLYFVDARLVGSAMHHVSVGGDGAQAVLKQDRGRVHFDRSSDLDFLLRIAEHQGTVTVDAFAMGSSEPISRQNHLGAELRSWFKDNIMAVPTSPNDATRVLKMRGLCREIAALLPRKFVDQVLGFDGTPRILVMSKDPYVPWELAYLAHEGDETGILLGAKAAVGRWPVDVETPERLPPRDPVEVDEIVIVTAAYDANPLPHADAEAAELAHRWRAAPVDGTVAEFLTLLDGRRPWRSLHVAVHGSNKPGAKSDGLLLTDAAIDDASIRGAGRLGPLVFLNACEVGGGAGGLTSWAGLPAAFISRGAQAVVAPLWAIKDDIAKEAALAYYDLCQEHGPADAIRQLRERFPIDDLQQETSVTWLAYQYFGHPGLRVQLPRR